MTRIGSVAGELVLGALRRRKQAYQPRVRIRVDHGQARILERDSEASLRMLTLAERLLAATQGDGTAAGRHI